MLPEQVGPIVLECVDVTTSQGSSRRCGTPARRHGSLPAFLSGWAESGPRRVAARNAGHRTNPRSRIVAIAKLASALPDPIISPP